MNLLGLRNQCRWIVAMFAMCMLVSCGESSRYEEEYGAPTDQEAAGLRIVTLAPALTKMIVDLEKTSVLVAVGEHDAAAPKQLPTVGNAWEVDTEALIKARPTHVLMQVGKDDAPARLKELARTNGFELVTYPYPATINGVADILTDNREKLGAVDPDLHMTTTNVEDLPTINLRDLQSQPLDGTSVGAILGEPLKAQTLWLRILTKLNRVQAITEGAADETLPRVLMVFGAEGTVMASGPGTVNDELLRAYLHAENAAADATVTAPTYDREALLALDPDVILLLMPGAPPLEAIDKDDRLTIFRSLDIKAVRENRIVLLNDPMILLPSTNLADVAVEMAKAIHPDRAELLQQLLTEGPTTSSALEALRSVTREDDEDEVPAVAPAGSTTGD